MEYFVMFIGAFIGAFVGSALATMLVKPTETGEIPIVQTVRKIQKEKKVEQEIQEQSKAINNWLYGSGVSKDES